MSNTPDHVGRPQTVEALGRTFTLARWTRAVWGEFLDWARNKLPDPRKAAVEFLEVVDKKDAALRDTIVREALAESLEYLSVNSPRVARLLDSLEGTTRLVYLLLKPAHPDATE